MRNILELLRFITLMDKMSNKINFACLYLYGSKPTSLGVLAQLCTLEEWRYAVNNVLNNMRDYGIWKIDETEEVLLYWYGIEHILPTSKIGEKIFRYLMYRYDCKRKNNTIEKSFVVRILQKLYKRLDNGYIDVYTERQVLGKFNNAKRCDCGAVAV